MSRAPRSSFLLRGLDHKGRTLGARDADASQVPVCRCQVVVRLWFKCGIVDVDVSTCHVIC